MPIMTGLECISELRKWEQNNNTLRQKIICVSGEEIEEEKVLATGMDYFIKKPLTKQKLKNLLNKFEES